MILCDGPLDGERTIKPSGWRARMDRRPAQVIVHFCKAPRVRVSHLQLSIGGNDIGFGGVIGWTLGPKKGHGPVTDLLIGAVSNGSVVCPAFDKHDPRCVAPGRPGANSAEDNIAALVPGDGPYGGLHAYLGQTPSLASADVSHLKYPDALDSGEAGVICPLLNRHYRDRIRDLPINIEKRDGGIYQLLVSPGMEALQEVAGRRTGVNGLGVTALDGEARAIRQHVMERLNQAIGADGAPGGAIGPVDTSLHGWCAQAPAAVGSSAVDKARAERDMLQGVWRARGNSNGENRFFADAMVAPFKPYDQTQARLFRTPNDAALTQLEPNVFPFSGAFHPTAQYHLLAARLAAPALAAGRITPAASTEAMQAVGTR